MYNKIVLEHFKNPHNQGSIAEADGVGEVGNPICGDVMKIYIKVQDDRIQDIKFETLGCGAAIASTSMLTDLVKGKTLDEALQVTKQDVVDALGGLPHVKLHCSLLAIDGLKKAIEDYRGCHLEESRVLGTTRPACRQAGIPRLSNKK